MKYNNLEYHWISYHSAFNHSSSSATSQIPSFIASAPTALTFPLLSRWVFWRHHCYAHLREIYSHKINDWWVLLKTADLITALIWGAWPGSSTLWLQYGRLLEQEALERFLPIRYTTVCCSHVECEHQLAARTLINFSCRHVREVKIGLKPWTIRQQGALYTLTEAWWTGVVLIRFISSCQRNCRSRVILYRVIYSATAVFRGHTRSRSGRTFVLR